MGASPWKSLKVILKVIEIGAIRQTITTLSELSVVIA